MKCSNCGSEIEENAKFCSNCGQKIEVVENTQNSIEEPKVEEKPSENLSEKPQVEESKVEEKLDEQLVVKDEHIDDNTSNIAEEKKYENIDNVEQGEKSKESFLTKFVKKHVGDIDEGPVIKNKFVIICFIITGIFVVACLFVFIVYNIYLNTLLTKV